MRLDEITGEPNLHGEISQFIEDHGAQIEDWKDQARLIMQYLLRNGASKTISGKRPVLTGMGTYMYLIEFLDEDGETRWLAFDDDSNIADVTIEMPNPASYS
jgi:hypothetical protein